MAPGLTMIARYQCRLSRREGSMDELMFDNNKRMKKKEASTYSSLIGTRMYFFSKMSNLEVHFRTVSHGSCLFCSVLSRRRMAEKETISAVLIDEAGMSRRE
jgi:hypothetical protein